MTIYLEVYLIIGLLLGVDNYNLEEINQFLKQNLNTYMKSFLFLFF